MKMTTLGYQQVVSLILLNLIALWLTYGYLVAVNPLTVKEVSGRLDCQLIVNYPEVLVYGEEFSVSGKLICKSKMRPGLMVQALSICGDIHTLTVNTTIVKDDGSFNVGLEMSFPKPSVSMTQCSLTVHVVSKTVSMGLIDKKTLPMIVPS